MGAGRLITAPLTSGWHAKDTILGALKSRVLMRGSAPQSDHRNVGLKAPTMALEYLGRRGRGEGSTQGGHNKLEPQRVGVVEANSQPYLVLS
jgi:hypothetical protein